MVARSARRRCGGLRAGSAEQRDLQLAAAGVVFVFPAPINRLARQRSIAPEGGLPDILPYLDLCALGTLCDMSPLTGVNRAFVRQGLAIMSRGENVGLRALADVSGKAGNGQSQQMAAVQGGHRVPRSQ